MKHESSTLFTIAALVTASLSGLLSCNAILGIESDRQFDPNYEDGGSTGCTDRTDCTKCTNELERCLCEGGDSASCGTEDPADCEGIDDDCMTCACQDCTEDYRNCIANTDCRKIRECFQSHTCDLDTSSPESCYSAAHCGDIIDTHGGPQGEAKQLLDRLVTCAKKAGCPCGRRACTKAYGCEGCPDCMATCQCQGKDNATCQDECEVQPCSPANECAGCGDCLSSCKCEGRSDAQCRSECAAPCTAEDACAGCTDCVSECVCLGQSESDCENECTVSTCSFEDDGCVGCSDCVARCVCLGQSESDCQTQCTCSLENDACTGCLDCMAECQCNGNEYDDCHLSCETVSTCSPETGCTDCSTCFEKCRCNEGTIAACTRECANVNNDDCTPGISCTGCGTCTAKCTCEGGSAKGCMTECGMPSCPTDCTSCASCTDKCVCEGGIGDPCIATCLGGTCDTLSLLPCDDCACRSCPEDFGRCMEDKGCLSIAQCMEDLACRGAGCFTTATCLDVVDLWGGMTGRSAALAEQLVMCRDAAACDCSGGGSTEPSEISCGNLSCVSYTAVSPQPNVTACCPPTVEEDCGLDVSKYLNGGCVPLGQPGYVDTTCPDLVGPPAPYPSEITLRGCCRPDNVCGFYDDAWLGLGCIKPELVDAASTTGCTYEPPVNGL